MTWFPATVAGAFGEGDDATMAVVGGGFLSLELVSFSSPLFLQAMNQARRSQDLMMSQIENQPGGFNALRRLYTVRFFEAHKFQTEPTSPHH